MDRLNKFDCIKSDGCGSLAFLGTYYLKELGFRRIRYGKKTNLSEALKKLFSICGTKDGYKTCEKFCEKCYEQNMSVKKTLDEIE